jgi:hypothetical protein
MGHPPAAVAGRARILRCIRSGLPGRRSRRRRWTPASPFHKPLIVGKLKTRPAVKRTQANWTLIGIRLPPTRAKLSHGTGIDSSARQLNLRTVFTDSEQSVQRPTFGSFKLTGCGRSGRSSASRSHRERPG